MLSLGGLQHSRRIRLKSGPKTANRELDDRKSRGSSAALRQKTVSQPLILRVPAWKPYSWLVHGFSTRAGGVSTAYRHGAKGGDLNLGFTASDTRENVHKNRELFLCTVWNGQRVSNSKSAQPQWTLLRQVYLRQIHSGLVQSVAPLSPGDNSGPDVETLLRGDGSITTAAGTLLGIQTADCFPILVADTRQRIVAAFHAGWRGTLARIAERGVGRMRAEFGSRPEDLTAAIGPGIGPCCFSVGEKVRMEFRSQFAYAEELFKEIFDLDPVKQKYPMLFLTARAPGHSNLGPSIHLDLIDANRRQLLDAGLKPGAIHSLNLCTACDTKRFFSHRAEQGFTGRMLNVIGIV